MQVNSANAKILIVEDDPEIGKLLALAIQENGMVATVAEDGHVMNALLRSNEFDLIILDVMLPGEDGLSICRRIRSEKTTPIILLTALGEEVDRIVGLEVGADDYITKPFSPVKSSPVSAACFGAHPMGWLIRRFSGSCASKAGRSIRFVASCMIRAMQELR